MHCIVRTPFLLPKLHSCSWLELLRDTGLPSHHRAGSDCPQTQLPHTFQSQTHFKRYISIRSLPYCYWIFRYLLPVSLCRPHESWISNEKVDPSCQKKDTLLHSLKCSLNNYWPPEVWRNKYFTVLLISAISNWHNVELSLERDPPRDSISSYVECNLMIIWDEKDGPKRAQQNPKFSTHHHPVITHHPITDRRTISETSQDSLRKIYHTINQNSSLEFRSCHNISLTISCAHKS